jgi:hypothetical protein
VTFYLLHLPLVWTLLASVTDSKCIYTLKVARYIVFLFCFVFSLSNLQILKKIHHPITDDTTFLYLDSVPCVIPVIVIQKYEQSMYCLTLRFILSNLWSNLLMNVVFILLNDYQRNENMVDCNFALLLEGTTAN